VLGGLVVKEILHRVYGKQQTANRRQLAVCYLTFKWGISFEASLLLT